METKHSNYQYVREYVISKRSCRSIIGAILSTTGIMVFFVKGWVWELVGTSLFTLKPNSEITNFWQKPNDPIKTDIYVFNWTNSEDFSNFSVRPKFEELGPFKYNQATEKTNLIWNDNNTVTYYNKRTWYFHEDLDTRSLHEKIVTLDIINVVASHLGRYWNYYIKKLFSSIMHSYSRKIDISTTVDQLLHNGFDDFFISLYNYVPFLAAEIPRFDKFALIRIRNGSDDFEGLVNMGTGVNGNFDVLNWNYEDETPYYNGSCSKVRGSLGEFYSRPLKKDKIDVFIPDICRSAALDFEEEVYVNGILGYKYSVGESALDNGSHIPENACTCAGDCIPSGILNASSCRFGLPIYYSLPHFYGADPVYLDAIEGLKPDKKVHEAYVVLEPHTSIPLIVYFSIQVNIHVHPVDDLELFENVREVFIPIIWTHQEVTLPKDIMRILRIYLALPYIIVGVAVTLMCIGLYLQFFNVCKSGTFLLYESIYKRVTDLVLNYRKVPLQANKTEEEEEC